MTPKYENAGGSKFGVTLRASALLTQHPPRGALWGVVEGVIVPIQNTNEIDSKVLNNKVMGKIVKSHFLQQKNHNFFVNQVRKILFISFNQKYFGQYFIKKRHCKILNR